MKILIVDDSVVFRSSISLALKDVDGISVYKTVSNGQLAVDEVRENDDIDLITLDMEMPVMDGMETVREIRKFNNNVKIIIFASTTASSAARTIEVLNLGANDFIAKIEGDGTMENNMEMIRSELVPKIQALEYKTIDSSSPELSVQSIIKADKSNGPSTFNMNMTEVISSINVKPDLILLASSTGGPTALNTFFESLDHKISIPMLLVQHMPPIFTSKLAEALTKVSPVEVVEAKSGNTLENGKCYLAPGDFHMVLNKDLSLSLNQDEKVCYVRPSADVLFESVARNFSQNVLTIVMTGMGSDGRNGCIKLQNNRSHFIVQDEESSVVWGMPGAIVKSEVDPFVLNLKELALVVNQLSNK